MNPVVFKHPPLVEIVAELRWDIPGMAPMPQNIAGSPIPIFPVPAGSAHEIQFMNFASKAGSKGFGLIERVIPPGFPMLQNQVAFRYRSATGGEGIPVFQLGPGVFSINIVPPYKSWENFVPFIDLGLGLLFDSLTEGQQVPFSGARLRYIDAFGDDLRQGKSTVTFLAEDLGLAIQLPHSISKFCVDQDAVKPAFTVSMPIEMGNLELSASEAWIRNARSLVMQTTVLANGPLAPDKQALIGTFNSAHDIIHEAFVGMTTSLHGLMTPEADE